MNFTPLLFHPPGSRGANPPPEAGFSLPSCQQMAAPLKADSLNANRTQTLHSQVATKEPAGVSTTPSSSAPPFFFAFRGGKNDSMVKKKIKQTARVVLCGRLVPPLTKRVLHSQKH